MFVVNLNPKTTNESLLEFFSKFGKVSNAYIIKKPGSVESRGFGYVTFATEELLNNVLAIKHRLDDTNIIVESFLAKEVQKKLKTPLQQDSTSKVSDF